MTATDSTLTGSIFSDVLALLGLIVLVVILIIVVDWLRNRYAKVELTRDTGVSAEDPLKTFLPGIPGNPTLVTFLELQFPGRIESVMMMHRVGAAVTFTDGTMQMFAANGKDVGEKFNPDDYRTKRS